jgi:hypothetical protein
MKQLRRNLAGALIWLGYWTLYVALVVLLWSDILGTAVLWFSLFLTVTTGIVLTVVMIMSYRRP